MALDFSYPAALTPDQDDGGFVVTFRDLPEAITQGENTKDALAEAADALEEAIAGRVRRSDEIPAPSRPRQGEHLGAGTGADRRQSCADACTRGGRN